MSNENKQDVPEDIKALSKLISKELKISDTGVAELPKDTFEKTLPKDLTMEMVKKVQSHTTNAVAALALATGEAGFAHLRKHKGLNEVSSEMAIGHDKTSVQYSCEKTVMSPALHGREASKIVKHGQIRVSYEARAAGKNRGALKKICAYLSDQAAAAAAS